MPLGALWTGMVAQQFGETFAVVVNASLAFAFAGCIYLLVPKLRRQ
jgi:hypothetical protein